MNLRRTQHGKNYVKSDTTVPNVGTYKFYFVGVTAYTRWPCRPSRRSVRSGSWLAIRLLGRAVPVERRLVVTVIVVVDGHRRCNGRRVRLTFLHRVVLVVFLFG